MAAAAAHAAAVEATAAAANVSVAVDAFGETQVGLEMVGKERDQAAPKAPSAPPSDVWWAADAAAGAAAVFDDALVDSRAHLDVLSAADQEKADAEADARQQRALSFGLSKWRKKDGGPATKDDAAVQPDMDGIGERARAMLDAVANTSSKARGRPTVQQLEAMQREMKARLKTWEGDFAAAHGGQAPTNIDKRGIREWYAQYQLLRKATKEARRAHGHAAGTPARRTVGAGAKDGARGIGKGVAHGARSVTQGARNVGSGVVSGLGTLATGAASKARGLLA